MKDKDKDKDKLPTETTLIEEPITLTPEATKFWNLLKEDSKTATDNFHYEIKAEVESEVMKNASSYKNVKEMQAAIVAIKKA